MTFGLLRGIDHPSIFILNSSFAIRHSMYFLFSPDMRSRPLPFVIRSSPNSFVLRHEEEEEKVFTANSKGMVWMMVTSLRHD